ncbi:Probable cobalt transporter subunit (CbtA) [Klenkia marina]|uniref:Probable cobalt transporter subunit (CbtA) n=1 Tax=Klenkia marina TaxID=1960309 RepID=A0A1G4YCG2_9ACTN|nr:CbtA family protein [Klenkia marina]SCX51015.1 Probable cobalt transporter subunit (CbtA) [Klenkia marina]
MATAVEDRAETAPRFAPLLGRFALAGVVAGAASGLWALVVTERAIAPALALEEARGSGHDHGHEELVSRSTQLVGGFLGTVFAAVVFSVVVAAVYAAVRHRLPGRTDAGRAAVLAAIGFGVFALLPAVKMPANPPAVGDPGTVGTRTAIYIAVLGAGVVTALLVSAMVGTLRARGLHPSAVAAAGVLATVALVAATVLLVPDNPDAIGADVPAAVVWDFRLASLGQLAVLWTTLGLTAGYLVDRLARRG